MPTQASLLPSTHSDTPDLSFAERLLRWYAEFGRKDLPWQQERSPYRVWVSEIMLQQTQVATVIPYYERFMAAFPTVNDLAAADEDQVLHLWTGLGYYARARNLHRTARLVVDEYGGQFPETLDELVALPGIGRSTAGAILALGCNKHAVILDGNVKRVLTRHDAVEGWPGQSAVDKKLWELAASYTPDQNFQDYTQAIMDLGATLCTRTKPNCPACPVQMTCQGFLEGRSEEFPHRKPKKTLPVRATHMLIFLDADNTSVLLEKRPAQGIWGGLWSFPEVEDPGQVSDTDLSPMLEAAGKVKHWPSLRHTFSHYHLDITPVVATLEQSRDTIMENTRWHWYDLRQPPELGLAAPVKKLLVQLGDERA